MGIGAVLGGAAEGAGPGLGRFSNALLQVMGSQQQRRGMEEQREFRASESAYRRHRDQVSDAASREALDLQERTLEARTRDADRSFAHALRAGGWDFDYHPEGAPAPASSMTIGPPRPIVGPGGGPAAEPAAAGEGMKFELPPRQGVGDRISRRFTVGDYNPDQDPALQRRLREIEATAAARPGPAGPTMSVGGMTAPTTPAGRATIEDHMNWRSSLPGQTPAGARDPARDQLLIGGALARMQGEDGEIDYLRLESVLDELRRRPGVTNDDLDLIRDRFTRQY